MNPNKLTKAKEPVTPDLGLREFPRSDPYVPPPQDLAALEARLRRWTFFLSFGFLAALLLTLWVGIYFVDRSSASREDAKSFGTEPALLVRDPDSFAAATHAAHAVGSAPGSKNAAAARSLELVGTLTTAHLYQSYLYLGLLADGAEKGMYPAEEAAKLLDTVTSLLATVDRQLSKLAEMNLASEDKRKLERIKHITNVLRTEAKELRAYWTTGEQEHSKNFHKARAEAWAGISALLEIKK